MTYEKTRPKRVIIESPYGGDVELNTRYARACLRDALTRGEAPFASHLLYTQPGVLDDGVPEERHHGITSGFAWHYAAELSAVYTDLGISSGMLAGVMHAKEIGLPYEYRRLRGEWSLH